MLSRWEASNDNTYSLARRTMSLRQIIPYKGLGIQPVINLITWMVIGLLDNSAATGVVNLSPRLQIKLFFTDL